LHLFSPRFAKKQQKTTKYCSIIGLSEKITAIVAIAKIVIISDLLLERVAGFEPVTFGLGRK
jgi:hypothetical protein